MRSPKAIVGEMWSNFDVSRSTWFGPAWNALRSMFQESFFKKPLFYGTTINYDLARALYRGSSADHTYGSGFVRAVIDLNTEYIGLPSISETADDLFLNECITDYWAPELQQLFRDCMRDSKVIVRYRQPSLLNKLVTEQDRMHGKLEVIPPEEVDLTFDPTDPDLVVRAAITHFIDLDTRSLEEVVQGSAPRRETHEIVEVITASEYTYWDKTSGSELVSWKTINKWGFVPFWVIYNEYAADLGGGQSDIEPILAFITAFHDVLVDVMAAHKYHSIPKAFFSIKDVNQFIKNNWPEVWDETTGRPKVGAKITLSGREVYFFNVDEKGGFIEARSVLGDSKTLLEFLIDCICIASETPRWALLAETRATPETDAIVQPFVKKIQRKRVMFKTAIAHICKMAMVANNKTPDTPRISWPPVRISDLVSKGQAIQQLIMGFDVAGSHEWISDPTVVKILGSLFEEIDDPEEEMAAAKNNVIPAVPAPAPASLTQGSQTGPTNAGTNGGGSSTAKKKVKKALATTAGTKN